MDISAKMTNDTLEFLLNGELDGYDNYVDIKAFVRSHLAKAHNFTFYFVNAASIDAYILGFLLKLRETEHLEINIVVSSAKLYNFLQYYEFSDMFDIKIKEYE